MEDHNIILFVVPNLKYEYQYVLPMHIAGEVSYSLYLELSAQGTSKTFEFNLGVPSNVYAKVALTSYREAATGSTIAEITIKSIKKKRSDGLITEVDINTIAAYDPQMTSIKVLIYGFRVWISGILTLEVWEK